MPATSGRVRTPHNNRMSTSGSLKTHDIWSKTIGHDPYANENEEDSAGNAANALDNAEKAKSVMEMARTQNVTDGADRHGFTAKLYLGLKKGKIRKSDISGLASNNRVGQVDPKLQQLLEDPDSSSEEEFVEENDDLVRDNNDSENDGEGKNKIQTQIPNQAVIGE